MPYFQRTPALTAALAAFIALAAPLRAQPSADLRVDSIMRAVMSARLIPGAAVVVVKDGRVIKETAYGLASIELNVPATTRTLFQIASATKNVTGLAIMQLVQGGKFGLDDRVTTRLDGLPSSWAPVTVRQILSHTSGLPDMILDPEKGVWLPGSRDSVLAQLSRMPVKPAGSEWAYNQTNYMLLGMLIDKFGGMEFRDYFQQKVLRPFGVNDVAFGDTRTVVAGRATEYTRLGLPAGASKLTDLKAFSYEYPDALYTAAGIFMHAEDMGRWLVAIVGGGGVEKSTFDLMTRSVSLNDGKPFHFPDSEMGYGLGWITIDTPKHRAFGGSGGGRTTLLVYPDDHLAVAVLTNLQGAGPESLVEMIASVYRGGA